MYLSAFWCVFITVVLGHGYLYDPPGRSSLHRWPQFRIPEQLKNYNDMGVGCYGVSMIVISEYPQNHTIQRPIISKRAKLTIFYDITVILQYCWDKTIARSGDMLRDDSGIFSLVITSFGITNTSVQNFAIRISSVKTVPKCLRKLKVF